nr:MAG TPA: hypothetical protein [Caudoviricetes sp.]
MKTACFQAFSVYLCLLPFMQFGTFLVLFWYFLDWYENTL